MNAKQFSVGIVGRVSESAAMAVCNMTDRVVLHRAPGFDWKLMRNGDARARLQLILSDLADLFNLSLYELASATGRIAIAVSGTDNRFSTGLLEQCFVGFGFPIESIRMCSLAEASHIGAFLGKEGLLIRCGHGVSTFLKSTSGQTRLTGGWGTLTGDRGSGPWLGRKALVTITEVIDGNSSCGRSDFACKLLDAASTRSPVSLVEHLETIRFCDGEFGVQMQLHYLGALTVALAEEGDTWALDLVRRSRNQILEMVELALSGNSDSSLSVCLRGTLFERFGAHSQNLLRDLAARFPAIASGGNGDDIHGAYEAVVGAAILSLELSDPSQIEEAATRLVRDCKQVTSAEVDRVPDSNCEPLP